MNSCSLAFLGGDAMKKSSLKNLETPLSQEKPRGIY